MSPDVLTEISAAKPAAPPELRERVRAIAAQQPAPRRSFRLRRLMLVAAPVAAAAALGTAGVIGLTQPGDQAGGGDLPVMGAPASEAGQLRSAQPESADTATGIPTDPGRAQRFEGSLTLRVDDADAVSDATKRAMRLAQSLGGYVVSSSLSTGDDQGSANVTIRVPIARVQTALLRLSELGTIVHQQVSLEDLQQQLDELNRRVADLRAEIATLEQQLRGSGLSDGERARLRARLEQARLELEALTSSQRQTREEASYATLTVAITTEDVFGAPPEGESRLDRVLDVLVWEALVALYVLVAVAPLAILAGIAWLVWRVRRRREEARLLEQS